MAKFYGTIGYAMSEEKMLEVGDEQVATGVWTNDVVERPYTGDVIRDIRRWGSTGNVNPDSTISETISIVADDFILANERSMKFVKWKGATWQIASVTIEYPRVVIEIGGLFNGETHAASSDSA